VRDDPRIERGMQAQLRRRRELLDAGQEPLGWKVGFGSPAALERLGTDGALVGFLLRSGLVTSGGPVSIEGWTAPAAEPEIALHLADRVAPGSGRARVEAAIGAFGQAIELADVDRPPDDPETILGANVFQRAVALGPPVPWAQDALGDLRARVLVNGEEVAATDDLEALTGDVVALLAHVADVLGEAGEELVAGEVVIMGSIVPPLAPRPGDHLRFELIPLGEVELTLASPPSTFLAGRI
jgi:2-keto-4-pentenoate hydratase